MLRNVGRRIQCESRRPGPYRAISNTGKVFALIASVLIALSYGAHVKAQAPGQGPGFTLLDFKTPANINAGQWFKWVYPPVPSNNPNPIAPGGTRRGAVGPFSISYKVDPQFMHNQDPTTKANAKSAVDAAFQTWSDGTNGYMQFDEAPWGTVVNLDATFHAYYEGPPLAEWCANYCPGCAPCGPIWPGWGADIDIFSRPTGFQLLSNGFTYNMTSGILGFAAIHRTANGIWSVDIYLNESFTWTTEPALARPPISGSARYSCHPLAHIDQPMEGFEPATELGSTVYDIQTVVLHELGHALGFDHPNQACPSGAVLDPYTRQFLSCSNFTPAAVMHGAYNGVKRELADPDIGGLAFLYRPRKLGDVDADDVLTISDAVSAMILFQNPDMATPYEVSTLDFINHNGRIDIDEVVMVLYWVLDPINYTPGVVSEAGSLSPKRSSSTITLNNESNPPDCGLGKTFSLIFSVENPDFLSISGWDLLISYDPAVFSNPRVTTGSMLPGGSWASTGSTAGTFRFAKVGFPPGDQSVSGTLGTLTFDVNLPAAALTPDVIMFPYLQTNLAIVDPVNQMIRIYGAAPGDTLIAPTPEAMSYLYDVNGDGCVDIEDVYAYALAPVDVSKNGSITDFDRRALNDGVRFRELQSILTTQP